MRKLFSTFVAIGAALVLSSCGGAAGESTSAASSPAAASSPMSSTDSATSAIAAPSGEATSSTDSGSHDFAFATGMTFGKFEIPGKPDTGFVKIMERYGEVEDVSFVNVKIDNRDGQDEAWVMNVRVYDKAGAEYLFVDPRELLDKMYETDDSKMDYDSEYMKYFDKYGDTVSMGEVGTSTLISLDKLPSDIARVIVDTGAFAGDVEAVTLEDAEQQGYPLDF